MGRSSGLLCLFCIGILLLVGTKNGPPPGFFPTTANSYQAVRNGPERPVGNSEAFRSSKRRVPRGPDPIHNRYLYSGMFSGGVGGNGDFMFDEQKR